MAIDTGITRGSRRRAATPTPIDPKMMLSAKKLKKRMHGKWIELLLDAGLKEEHLGGSRGKPCPKCKGENRFAPFSDVAERGAVHCRNCFTGGSVLRPGDGIATIMWFKNLSFIRAFAWIGNWLYTFDQKPWKANLKTDTWGSFLGKTRNSPAVSSLEVEEKAREFNGNLVQLFDFAKHLNLPIEVLHRLCVGVASQREFPTTWPMLNAEGRMTGIRFRSLFGAKWSMLGGQHGLFADRSLLKASNIDRLLVCEGATDTAAMMALGFYAIGLPSKGAALPILVNVLNRIRPREIVVVADRDANGGGLTAAQSVQDRVWLMAPTRLILPPDGIKDAREWRQSGADRSVIEQAIDLAEVKKLTIGKGK